MAHSGHRVVVPFWSRLWDAIKPPPPVPSQRKPWNRSQRRLFWGTLSGLICVGTGLGIYQYVSSAEDRANDAFQKGMEFLGPGRYDDAVAQFTRAIAIWPQHAQAYLQRGKVRQVLSEPDAALGDFERALKIEPNLAPAYTARAVIYIERGDFQKALSELDQSIRIQPSVDAYYQLGQIAYRLKQFQKAVADYDQAIAIDPDLPYFYLARASAKSALGDAVGAAQDRETAVSLQLGR